jgi:hypothetical protein
MKLEFSRRIFVKYRNTNFHENSFSGSRMFLTDGRTDGRTDRQTQRRYLSLFKILRTRLKMYIFEVQEWSSINVTTYARNSVLLHKKFPERGFAQHVGITGPNPSVGRGVTVLNLFLVTVRRLTVWVGCQPVLPQQLYSLSVAVLWASVEDPVTIG